MRSTVCTTSRIDVRSGRRAVSPSSPPSAPVQRSSSPRSSASRPGRSPTPFGGPVARLVVWLRLPVAGLLIALVWAVLYQVLPDVPRRFRFLTPGSVVAVAVWLIASWGFLFYVLDFGVYNKTYGPVGCGVVVLV